MLFFLSWSETKLIEVDRYVTLQLHLPNEVITDNEDKFVSRFNKL